MLNSENVAYIKFIFFDAHLFDQLQYRLQGKYLLSMEPWAAAKKL